MTASAKKNAGKIAALKKGARRKEAAAQAFYVYILETENGSLYTGYTDDPAARFAKHCSGKGAKFTRAFRPVRMAACWKVAGAKGNAMKVEAFIKSLSRAEKETLAEKPSALLPLYRSRRAGGIRIVSQRRSFLDRVSSTRSD